MTHRARRLPLAFLAVASARTLQPLADVAAYHALVAGLARDDAAVTAVLHKAPWCRTCRAVMPKMRGAASKYPARSVAFYELLLPTSSAAEEIGIDQLPFLEVYVGATRVDGLVMPPQRLAWAHRSLSEALERRRETRLRAERRRIALRVREIRREAAALLAERAALLDKRKGPLGRGQRLLALRAMRAALRELAREKARLARRRHLIALLRPRRA